jgi:hypothetical protein
MQFIFSFLSWVQIWYYVCITYNHEWNFYIHVNLTQTKNTFIFSVDQFQLYYFSCHTDLFCVEQNEFITNDMEHSLCGYINLTMTFTTTTLWCHTDPETAWLYINSSLYIDSSSIRHSLWMLPNVAVASGWCNKISVSVSVSVDFLIGLSCQWIHWIYQPLCLCFWCSFFFLSPTSMVWSTVW